MRGFAGDVSLADLNVTLTYRPQLREIVFQLHNSSDAIRVFAGVSSL